MEFGVKFPFAIVWKNFLQKCFSGELRTVAQRKEKSSKNRRDVCLERGTRAQNQRSIWWKRVSRRREIKISTLHEASSLTCTFLYFGWSSLSFFQAGLQSDLLGGKSQNKFFRESFSCEIISFWERCQHSTINFKKLTAEPLVICNQFRKKHSCTSIRSRFFFGW